MRKCGIMYRVAVLANLKKNAPQLPDQPADAWAELDSEDTVEAIVNALREGGHQAYFLEADVNLLDRLRENSPDICFNIAEGHYGDSREAQIPALLSFLGIPYTGSGALAHALSLDKAMTKRVWQSAGLRTARFQLFERPDEPLNPLMAFPLFVKPSREGTGKGVSASSIVESTAELKEQTARIIRTYRQPALVEPFLSGREITIGVIGNTPRQYAFIPLEIEIADVAPSERRAYSYHVKAHTTQLMQPATLAAATLREVWQMAIAAHNAIGTLDISRIDIRFDGHGVPYLLEINTIPGMAPAFSDLPVAADVSGMSYSQLVNTILNLACQRYGLNAPEPVIPDQNLPDTALDNLSAGDSC